MRKFQFAILSCLLGVMTGSALEASCCPRKPNPTRADYVIVGVGTAGAVVAKKLSDDHETSVVALQNGPNLNQDPLIFLSDNAIFTVTSALLENNPLYRSGVTIPQPDADNRELLWAMALPEGGASAINAGAWCRSTDQMNAQWEAIAGPNWSVSRITKVYKMLENYHGETTNRKARGYHGPISIRQVQDPTKVAQTFTAAVIQATGVPFVLDYNNPKTPIGSSSQLQYTQKGPEGIFRVSSGSAFLNRKVVTPSGYGVDGRKLRILYESTALKTIWEGNKAVGVEYLQDGETKRVYADKGVIVCAGVFSSSFLMHSGVGPGALLSSLGIPVIYDNPNVGQGLADQPHIVTIFSSNPADTPSHQSSGVFSQISWLPTPGGDPNIRTLRLATTNPIPGVVAALFDLVQPKSRGSITINSADPLVAPVIDLGELTNSDDLDLYVLGFQVYIKNINAALQAIDPLYGLVFPDPAILDDTALLEDFIRAEIGGNQHWQSHCRMAALANGGVVDSTGHVYGVQNLLVADDSISPLDMDGSPMASAYLIGANVALMLLGK